MSASSQGSEGQYAAQVIEVEEPLGPPKKRNSSDGEKERFESQRSLELRKFFAPKDHSPQDPSNASETAFNDTLNEDGALDAYAETVLWRLKGVHVMISLIDRGEQWFLGGARRAGLEVEDSCTWFGFSSIPTPGGLCENTLSLDLTKDEYPCFVVNDLSEDECFASLPVVNGSLASYRFYAGTPITTSHGINIGSFLLFDDEPRKGLSFEHRKFLHQSSANVMKHLEMKRKAAERRRVALMSRGIARFLEETSRDSVPVSPRIGVIKSELDMPMGHSTIDTLFTPTLKSAEEAKYQEQSSMAENGPDAALQSEDSTDTTREAVLDKIRTTLDYAADILRESLELDAGGVVFLDTAIGYTETGNMGLYMESDTTFGAQVEETQQEQQSEKRRQDSIESATRPTLLEGDLGSGRRLSRGQIRSSADKYRAAKVQAMSASKTVAWDPTKRVLDGKTLQTLLEAYPEGNVWYMDDRGYFSSLEQIHEQEHRANNRRRRSAPMIDVAKQVAEAAMLAETFPGAKQIIFLPLWDAGGDRWYSGVFVWSLSAVPVFTVDAEIAYLAAYTNSVMVTISRLDAISDNKMKADFISSISHEFRSPLHGILASADFLRESELSTSQLESISTIQNCGETLLDTINHVLDYSKINSFSKNEKGMISNELFQVTNLALLCEDVVNGMIAAKDFRGLEDDMPLHSYSRPANSATSTENTLVETVVDIERGDWYFKLQAGALRRIIMNLYGNAQKYTVSGNIVVQLKVLESRLYHPHRLAKPSSCHLSLLIRDSGCGMSSDFMERKLYHPFAQEDTFAPGIGLGLSIVLSIVNRLGGRIEIRSEVGKGTDVEVLLPLDKPEQAHSAHSTTKTSLDAHEALLELQTLAVGKTVLICREKAHGAFRLTDISWKCIKRYCSDWFGFKVFSNTDEEELKGADLVISDISHSSESLDGKRILVIHHGALSPSRPDPILHTRPVRYIEDPVGPFKLARYILALLHQEISNDSPRSRKDVGTQTPLASPEEFLPSMSEYGFRLTNSGSVAHAETSHSPYMRDMVALTPNETNIEDSEKQQALATFKALSLYDVPESFQPKLPQTPRKAAKEAKNLLNAASKSPQPPESSKPSSIETPLRILAVDDNAVNLQLLMRYLQKRRLDVIIKATNGIEAVAAVRESSEQPFDVIFMDISMPEMDGFEATRLIRSFEWSSRHRGFYKEPGAQSPPPREDYELDGILDVEEKEFKGAYVVALTGLASRRDRDRAEEIGFDEFFTKPISFAKIGELLKRLSAGKGQ